jgi:hypothetical protein
MSSSEILLYKLRLIGEKTDNIYKNIKYDCCPEKHKRDTTNNVLEMENMINNCDKELQKWVLDISDIIHKENKKLSYLSDNIKKLEKT